MEDFYKKAEDYMVAFLSLDAAEERSKDIYGRKGLTDEEVEELASSLSSQREALSKTIDHATQLSKKCDVTQEYCRLLQIGQVSEWGKITFTDDFAIALKDSVNRTIAAIDRAPTLVDDVLAAPALAWKWLDERGVAKWIVVAILALVTLAVLRALGYNLHGLIDLVKAVRGDK